MYDDEQIQDLLTQLRRRSPPLPSLARQKLLSRLLGYIQQSPALRRDSHQDYAAVLNKTLVWVCNHLEEFEPGDQAPSTALISWVNGHLKWRLLDLKSPRSLPEDDRTDKDINKIRQIGLRPVELDKALADDQGNQTGQGTTVPDPRQGGASLLDRWIEQLQQQQQHQMGREIRRYLETDPDGLLRACSPRNLPDCHCGELTRRIHLAVPPEAVRDIAKALSLSEQTLYTHWRTKCLPMLQIIALRHDPEVKAYAQQDPNHELRACYLEGWADCNCATLAQQLLLSEQPLTIKALAKTLKVRESDLTDHWQRRCLPQLKAFRL
jgi:AcrR family transcriptional regulator